MGEEGTKKFLDNFDFQNIMLLNKKDASLITEIGEKEIETLMLFSQKTKINRTTSFSVTQKSEDGTITGGSTTFVLRQQQ
jgi:endo-beta-N-acetylglucosaminidase D